MNTWSEILLPFANVAESLVPVLSLAAYIPQWRQLLASRDSRSISLLSWAVWALAYAISVFYAVVLLAVTGRGWPLVTTTALGFLFVLVTLGLAWRFRNTGDRSPDGGN